MLPEALEGFIYVLAEDELVSVSWAGDYWGSWLELVLAADVGQGRIINLLQLKTPAVHFILV